MAATASDPQDWAAQLATAFTAFGRAIPDSSGGDAFTILTRLAAHQVHGAQAAGITRATPAGFMSTAPTDAVVRQVDEIQYSLNEGPCVGAIRGAGVSVTDDLRTDDRWARFGPRTFEATGIISMMSYRLFVEDDPSIDAALNFYSRSAAAFDETSRAGALLLATHGALALSRERLRARATNLELALEHARDIGVSMGVLMALHKVTRDQAFDLLRLASQATQRKISDVALDVIDTGALPAQLHRRSGRST